MSIVALPEIRKARREDSGAIAELHCRRILTGLLTAMGQPFAEAFYETVIDSPIGFVYVATDEDKMLGFASGLVDGQQFYQDSLDHTLRKVADASFSSLIRRQQQPMIDSETDGDSLEIPRAEVVSMALEPGSPGGRVGLSLVRYLLAEFAARGVKTVRVTAEASDDGASRLYEQAGFHRIAKVRIHPAETTIVYKIILDASAYVQPH